MSDYRVAARYAKALIQLAEEQKGTDAVRRDLAGLGELIAQHADFAAFLRHAALSPREQQSVMDALLQGRVSALTTRLIALLIERRRLALLPPLCEAFEDQYRETHHILEAQLVSAFDLRQDQVEALRRKLENRYHQQIEMAVGTDPALLGGFVVRVRDSVHDCSVRGRLDALHARLAYA